MSETPPRIRSHAPLIGESNDDVLQRLLAMEPRGVRELVDAGVLWPSGMPRPPWIEGSAVEEAGE